MQFDDDHEDRENLDDLIAKAATSRLVSRIAYRADGAETDGWGEAERVVHTFDDGEEITVSRQLLTHEEFGMIQFQK